MTSANVIAQRGRDSEASITAVFPPTMIGAKTETGPSNDISSGAIAATTPTGSRKEKLKYGMATGFTRLNTWIYLSAHPA